MPWGVAAAAISAGGAIYSANASKSAASTQANAADSAAQAQLDEFNTINDQQAPYRTAGTGALNELNNYLGIPTSAPEQNAANFDSAAYIAAHPEVGDPSQWDPSNGAFLHYQMYGKNQGYAYTGNAQYNQQLAQSQEGSSAPGYGQFTHSFDASDLNANLAPNYQFMLDQGMGQARNTASATQGVVSGNALQGLNTFAQNYAQNAYQLAYSNYNNNQTQIYNRLASLAGLGQTATASTGQLGTVATQAASGYSTSAAAANAAGTVGSANAITGGLNNLGALAYTNGFGSGSSGSNTLGNSLGFNVANAGTDGLGTP